MSTQQLGLITICIVVLIVLCKSMYDIGAYAEKRRILGILSGMKLHDLSAELRYAILRVIDVVVSRIEERK